MKIGELRKSEELDRTFAALANPTRRAIIAKLAEKPATVKELAEPFDMTMQAVSNHVKYLQRAGLIVRGRHAQFRPCALDTSRLKVAMSWTDQCRQTWEASFARMSAHIKEMKDPTHDE